jgi:CheY-like chemotaxis protein
MALGLMAPDISGRLPFGGPALFFRASRRLDGHEVIILAAWLVDQVDAVVLDLGLPRLSGIDATARWAI